MNNKKKVPEVGLAKVLLNYSQINENLVLYFKKLIDENDGLVKVKLPYSLVLTDRADVIGHVLQKNHKNYTKTVMVRKTVQKQLGDGLFTSGGEYWLKQRKAIQPGFHKERLEGITRVIIEEINDYMDNVLDVYVETNEEVDLVEEMTKLTFQVITRSLFGQTIEDEKLNTIGETISNSHEYLMNETRNPHLKLWYYLKGDYAENRRLKKVRDKVVIDFIEERRASNEKVDDLLDMLLEIEYEDGSKMTNKQLLDETIVLLAAGHESPATALSWVWYLLSSHTEIEEKLLDSVLANLGDEDPTFGSVRGLGYALQVIEESMRLYPPSWFIDREPLEDDEVDGVKLKKGEDVGAFIYGLHRNPAYWENPDTFDPNRFSEENKQNHTLNSFLPYGGGPRKCIGRNLAQMEMQFIVAMLIKRYKFVLSPDQKIDFKPLLTLCPSNGIKVKVQKRVLKETSKAFNASESVA
ncbi:MAG: cytochrome P450 [Aureispira sp.]|jgi:cytochrome P450